MALLNTGRWGGGGLEERDELVAVALRHHGAWEDWKEGGKRKRKCPHCTLVSQRSLRIGQRKGGAAVAAPLSLPGGATAPLTPTKGQAC